MTAVAAFVVIAAAGLGGQDPAPSAVRVTAESPRVRFTINEGWRYADGDAAGAHATGFDDAAWKRVDLPHTWNAADAFGEEGGYRRGTGWYRRSLDVPAALRDRRIFLYFEGANQVAEVFVNGTSVGTHVGGYTAFVFDVTGHVRFDAPNLIAVRVDNAHDPDIPPLNADFTFFGGLYRDVWLLATHPVRIDVEDHASPGVFVDTPEISAGRATVRVRGAVVNGAGSARALTVRHRLVDPAGAEVVAFETRLEVRADSRAPFEARTTVVRPRLWSPEDPAVHHLVTEVSHDGVVVDRVDVPIGFRWFRVDARDGFFLNGEPRPLRGTNRHQDLAGVGTALSDAQHRADVEIVKATGFDFLRLAHYPQDPAVLETTDALGLLVWEEVPVVNIITMSERFAENADRMLVEMIRQHYNHPSVAMWGYMNEVLLVRPRPQPEGYVAAVAALATRLEATAQAEDVTRPTAMAISFDEIDDGSGLQDITDILGLNLYFGWYYRDLDGLGPFLDTLRTRHPQRPLLVSEYGAGSDERVHARAPVAFDFSVEHQRRFHETAFAQILERPWLVGSAVWNQFDFASAGRQDTKPAINQKGLYYHDRTPKDIAYHYRARRREEPVVRIAAHEWTRRAGSAPADAADTLVVYANRSPVELLHDGTSLGMREPQDGIARWSERLHAGINRFEAAAADVRDRVDIEYTDRSGMLGRGATRPVDIAVNVGGAYTYVDDVVWEPDRAYAAGRGWGHEGGRTAATKHRMLGTGAEPLFQAVRTGASTYRFDVPDGEYEVTLGFVEIEHDEAGVRTFDVDVNGDPVFDGLDLAGAAGRWTPVERRVIVRAQDRTGIVVNLTPRTGEPTLASLRVRQR